MKRGASTARATAPHLASIARDAEAGFARLVELADGAIQATARRDIDALFAAIAACAKLQNDVDPLVHVLGEAWRELPPDAPAASRTALLALIEPVRAAGERARDAYERLRAAAIVSRDAIVRELDQRRHVSTAVATYSGGAPDRRLNLVR